MAVEAFALGNARIAPGLRATIDLPVSVLSDHTPVNMSVHVAHGQKPGPTLFVSAALHGDEVIGVEIMRRLLVSERLKVTRGTLLAAPIVNTFGFLNHSRYLPDRRDLNRSFPGSARGSLAARLADLFMREVVERSDVGIDLHSAAIHRANMPQIRIAPESEKDIPLAEAFGAPIIKFSKFREGSLRHAAYEKGVGVLVYEGGEGLRFDEAAIRVGVNGILRVMRKLEMIPARAIAPAKTPPARALGSSWMRAPMGGLLRAFKDVGDRAREGEALGIVADPFGEAEYEVIADFAGIVIGCARLPVVNEGDALFHVARLEEDNAPPITL